MIAQENKIIIAVMRLFVKRLSAVSTRIERLLCADTVVSAASSHVGVFTRSFDSISDYAVQYRM
jgi:hypothetical protein